MILHFDGQCGRRLEFTQRMAASYQKHHPGKTNLLIDAHSADAITTLNAMPEFLLIPGWPKFTREQCVVALDLDYFGDFNYRIMQWEIVEFLLEYSKQNISRFGFGHAGWNTHQRLQILLTHNCSRRVEVMREFANAFLLKYPDEMLIKVSDDIGVCDLKAQTNAIHWIDGDVYYKCRK